jgi:pimeloyl-ACP methyl ester carboxylesterase
VGDVGAVLALHDAGRHGWDFEPVRAALSDELAGAQLIAFDQPAHGRSGGLDSLGDVGQLAALVQALIEWLELDRPVLLGHGLGGAIALRVALDAPRSVRGVMTLGTGAQQPVDDASFELMRKVTEGKARRPFDASVFAEGTPPDVMRPYFMQGMKTDPRATFGDLEACRSWDEGERLAALAVPVWAMVGEHERPEIRREAEALVETVPEAHLQVVEGAAHVLPIEAPEAVAKALRLFTQRKTGEQA